MSVYTGPDMKGLKKECKFNTYKQEHDYNVFLSAVAELNRKVSYLDETLNSLKAELTKQQEILSDMGSSLFAVKWVMYGLSAFGIYIFLFGKHGLFG